MDGGWEANSRLDNDNGDGDGNSGQCMHCESRRGIRYITSTTESQYRMRRGFAFLLHRIEYIKASVLSSSEQMQFPRSHNAILSIATQVNWYRGAARTPTRANGAQYGLHCASRSTSALKRERSRPGYQPQVIATRLHRHQKTSASALHHRRAPETRHAYHSRHHHVQ